MPFSLGLLVGGKENEISDQYNDISSINLFTSIR